MPVVHTTDKNGNKIACSEFWKGKDSYRELQNAFYDYMVSHNFNLLRGLPKEEINRQHLDIKEYKELTNFEVTKELVESITYDIPEETNITDLKKIVFNKNEKILNDIIKPKEDMIKKLYNENKAFHDKVDELEYEYKYNNKSVGLEFEYENKYERLENENYKLHNIIDRFYITINKFIKWICNKFGLGDSKEIMRDFEIETNTYLDQLSKLLMSKKMKKICKNIIDIL